MKEQTEFTYYDYLQRTIVPALFTTIVAVIPMIVVRIFIGNQLYIVLSFAVLAALWTCLAVFYVGMNKRERNSVVEFAKNKLHKNNK